HVVGEGGELPVEEAALAQPPDGGGHTALQAGVLARLRAVDAVEEVDRPLRRRRQGAPLGEAREGRQRLQDLPALRPALELDARRDEVAVDRGDPVAARAHREIERPDAVAVEAPEDLLRLALDPLLRLAPR